ncbi:MAG: L-threonylcarbamoyladenylate synthase [Bacteroidetes bacterium]|nr:L-threonylcarbamoyladenylate synthase [Bacteroidota bacterium]
MLLNIHPDNPQEKHIQTIVDCLKSGGVIIYPTDTIYAFGCDIMNKNAVEKICQLRDMKPEKANFSFVCHDLSQLSKYANHIDTTTFRLMKKALPGPFTFILEASGEVPKIFKVKKKTIGIRVPDNNICSQITAMLGNPIMSASLKADDEILEYLTDPELIYEKYEKLVKIVINGGYGHNEPSTVVDCSQGAPEVIREGIGNIHQYL